MSKQDVRFQKVRMLICLQMGSLMLK